MRDAVDYVVGRARRAGDLTLSAERRARGAHRAPRVGRSDDPELLAPRRGPPVVVRRDAGHRLERAARVPRRRRARAGRHRPPLPHLPRPARGRAGQGPGLGRERRRPGRGGRRARPRRRPCCSARARTPSGGREKPSILADAMEAVIGAVYLDAGLGRRPSGWCWACSASASPRPPPVPGGQDYKTRLQELAARRFDELPRYEVADDGPRPRQALLRHRRTSAASARGAGEGRSKKQAEQAAAREAWQALQARPTRPCSPSGRTTT